MASAIEEILQKSFAGAEGLLRSNKAINAIYGLTDKIAEPLMGRAAGTTRKMLSEGSEKMASFVKTMSEEDQALWKKANTKGSNITAEEGQRIQKIMKAMPENNISGYGKGDMVRFGLSTYAIGNTAYRFASGGGPLHDKNGNLDIVGIPIL